jgi:hypothetical protein
MGHTAIAGTALAWPAPIWVRPPGSGQRVHSIRARSACGQRSIERSSGRAHNDSRKRGGMHARLHPDRANRDDRLRRSRQERVRGRGMRGGRSTRAVLYRGYAIERSTGFWAESGSSRRLEMVVQHQGSLILTRTDVTGADGKP